MQRHPASPSFAVRCLRLFTSLVLLLASPLLLAQQAGAVYVATYLEVRPAETGSGAGLAAQYAAAAASENGNLLVTALQEQGRANRFVIIEAWQDQAAFDRHQAAAHTTQFRAGLQAIQAAPYDQRLNTGFALDPQAGTAPADAVFVVTHVDVPGPFREQAETLQRQLVEAGRHDAGHVRYEVYQQYEPRTNHFTMFTVWDSPAAFDSHGGTAHWAAFRAALGPMLGALYDERLYRPVQP